MRQILSLQQAIKKAQSLRKEQEKIVLAGGCFDIVHRGHLQFLQKSTAQQGTLFVLLESDANIRKWKGHGRPIHTQKDRAKVLSHVSAIDFIVLLPPLATDTDYDQMIFQLKPDIITTTKHDPARHHKERQASLVDAEVIDVIERLPAYSTTQLVQDLKSI